MTHPTRAASTTGARVLVHLALAGGLAVMGGCAIGQLIGGMAASAQRTGSHEVKAKYPGLHGKDFAVIVAADRSIQSEFPAIVPVATREITKMLSEKAGAKGVLPAEEVLRYQVAHPNWVAMSFDKLAAELAVDRLVYIEIREFALTDPGNIYIYNGIASGQVHVIEADSTVPSEFAFNEAVRVSYPDVQGVSPQQQPRAEVLGELAKRFISRASWMFFDHEEPNVMKY